MLVDRTKLRIEMIKRNMKSKQLAEKLGIDCSSLSLKLHGKRSFSETEISTLTSLFGKVIFFTK